MQLNEKETEQLRGYIRDLCEWEYDRVSSSGRETLDKLAHVFAIYFEDEEQD
jgi:hypothetical protein